MHEDFTYQQLALLRRVATHLAKAEDVHQSLSRVLDWLAQYCAMERGVIALTLPGGDELQADITQSKIPRDRQTRMHYKPGEGITGRVFATGEPVYIPQVDLDPSFLDRSGLRRSLGGPALAFYCVPITYRESVIGTLSVDRESALVSDPAADTAFLLDIALLIAPFVQRRRLEEHMEVYRQSKSGAGAFAKLIGSSPGVEAVRRMAIRVADASTTVLITGETGTGKGVVAQLIHDLSPRRELPFVEVNCGAIPENLVESELFGHEKGAFTGASAQRTGVLERSGSGTVFLDEIGELPLPAQTRLLRVLQTHEFERVGGSRTQRFQGRVVAATNRDLETALAEGTFRTDLYYRLNVFPIELPPLRERGKADVMLLADFFVQRFSREMGKEISRIDTPAIDMLTAYHWPGNVRELENVIERAVLLADTGVIHGHHLPPSLQLNRYADRQEDHSDFLTRVREYETELIVDALKDTNGNQSRAAAKLGITKRIMQYRIRKHGIDWRRFRGRGPV